MIRFIVFAALALAIATPAQAISPPPLPQSDGIRAASVTAALHAATATALPVATGLGATAIAGIGATATADIAAMATADMATAGIGPDMELPAAKCAGAHCGVQGTFAAMGKLRRPTHRAGKVWRTPTVEEGRRANCSPSLARVRHHDAGFRAHAIESGAECAVVD